MRREIYGCFDRFSICHRSKTLLTEIVLVLEWNRIYIYIYCFVRSMFRFYVIDDGLCLYGAFLCLLLNELNVPWMNFE